MPKHVPLSWMAAALMILGAGCGGSATPRAASSTTTAATSGASTSVTTGGTGDSSAPSSSVPPSSSSPSGNPFLRAPGRVAFLAPSGNISCEIDYAGGAATNGAFCETLSPAESANLAPDGSVKTCGLGCEGNAAENTPTLAYGRSAGLGPFQCASASGGVTCTVSGKGFEISRSGISPVGAPLVDLAPGSYSGYVESVGSGASRMTFTISSTGCSGVPAPGTWSVDLTGASFVANSEPDTGQGQAVTIDRTEWAQETQSRRAWTVVVTSGQPLEVTDGPTC